MKALFLACLCILCLIGCGDDAARLASQPTHILEAYAMLIGGFTLLFWLIIKQPIWPDAMLNAIKFGGFVSIITAPLFYLIYEKIGMSIAVACSGAIALICLRLVFPNEAAEIAPVIRSKKK